MTSFPKVVLIYLNLIIFPNFAHVLLDMALNITAKGSYISTQSNSTTVKNMTRRDVMDYTEGDTAACSMFDIGDVEKQEFYSPNYPNNYPNHSDCTRKLIAQPGYLLRLDFRDEFHIEPSEDCRFDYLEVRDGEHGYSHLIGKYCGKNFPPMLTSSDRYLWLRFRSDENIEYSGFRAVFTMVPKPTSSVFKPELEKCRMEVGGKEGYINRSDIKSETSQKAVEYNSPIDCMWVITVDTGWRIHLQFLKFSLDRPNDCDSNFIDVFPEKTDLPSRLHNFCGSIAEMVASKRNILHVRFMAEPKAINSTFSILYTAFRDKPKDELCKDDEYDCEDDTCISSRLRCNSRPNCRFRWDEEDCKSDMSALAKVLEDEHMIIILVIFFLILTGMCFTFVYNCSRKLLRDHQIIKEHKRQTRDCRLYPLDHKSSISSMQSPQITKMHIIHKEELSQSCSEHSVSPVRKLGTTPVLARNECYVPAAGDLLPILVRGKQDPENYNHSTTNNGDVYLAKEETPRDNDEEDVNLSLSEENYDPNIPEMKDSECQTRESLFQNVCFASKLEEFSETPPPPPPPPRVNQIFSGHRTLPSNFTPVGLGSFTTFGYTRNNTKIAPTLMEPKLCDQAEQVREKISSNSVGNESRPFTLQSTKSAPDVIATH